VSQATYIILEGLEEGNRFFTTNDPQQTEDEQCRLEDGTLAYRVVGYANTSFEAARILHLEAWL
jgi:hypothetical protein